MPGPAARPGVVVVTATDRLRVVVAGGLRGRSDVEVLAEIAGGDLWGDLTADLAAQVTLVCRHLRPAAVVLDVALPAGGALAVTRAVMSSCPTPILLVCPTDRESSLIGRDALAAGAVDVVPAPTSDGIPDWHRGLLRSLAVVVRVKVSKRPGLQPIFAAHRTASAPTWEHGRAQYDVVAIGASTGGPAAIATVLRGLPTTFELPMLLVLHVDEPATDGFTRWLQETTGHRVRVAEDGESVAAAHGQVLMAPPGRHLSVRERVLALTTEPRRHSCRPSVDTLFESVAREYGARAAGCLLTGMGSDGADGLLAIHRGGGLTITQDEATSVVYGMPAEAAKLGASRHILPVEAIGPALHALTTGRSIPLPSAEAI